MLHTTTQHLEGRQIVTYYGMVSANGTAVTFK